MKNKGQKHKSGERNDENVPIYECVHKEQIAKNE